MNEEDGDVVEVSQANSRETKMKEVSKIKCFLNGFPHQESKSDRNHDKGRMMTRPVPETNNLTELFQFY